MSGIGGAEKRMRIVAACICLGLAASVCLAQKKPASTAIPSTAQKTVNDTRKILAEKARSLELRGRPDMALQSWQQILLSDPNNAEALAGLAKDYKLIGSPDKSNEALERLRSINPNDPNIAKIAAMSSSRAESDRLRQAGELARQGKNDEAMRIYRDLYGDRPPDGDIGLAYYQTLYGTANGKQEAISAMRALTQRNPGDSRFPVELGIMLTYDARTRAEGIRLLEAHAKDADAQAGLRQALIWDAANPSSASELRQYLKGHPQDTEISTHLKENESKLAQMNSGIARTAPERLAFAALNAHRLEEAQRRFLAILDEEPDNARVQAGLGFLRMQENNFGAAISYLTQAEQNGFKARVVEDALEASRFWFTMGEATQAFDEDQFDLASAKYQAALAMRPKSREALNGLAGLLVKEQRFADAAGVYEQLLKVDPTSVDGGRGLFLAYARDGQTQKALSISSHYPPAVKAALAKDPEYLRTLAALYNGQNRPDEAKRTLTQALALPYPNNGADLKPDTRLEYAGILMEAKRYSQAVELYTQILNEDDGNLLAWMGLVSAHHEAGDDNRAIADVEKMSPAAYEAALAEPGFLSMLGAIYQQANQLEVAQGLLERSAKVQIAVGRQPELGLQLQLASIYLLRNNTKQAYGIYRQVLGAHPDSLEAWKGLIASLQSTHRDGEALQEIAQIPPATRAQLESDIEFEQTEASLYAATGDLAHATEFLNRVQAHYSALKTTPPASVEVQNAWLLYNTKNDRALYPYLMRLGARKDLTAAQRETVQTIWANWSVRRAATAIENGNAQRAVQILEAAAQAFPDNLSVRKAVAGGYVKAGRAKDAVLLYKSVPMQDATAIDFQGAVGAALAANDKAQAELWLRQALDRYPRDPAILRMAARFEESRGDKQRAADYLRASLAAMPQTTPADRLAHELAYPDSDGKIHRAGTPAELERLLDPNDEPFEKTAKLPPLPAYGADPYSGSAPVVLPQSQQSAQPDQWINSPSTTEAPDSSTSPKPRAQISGYGGEQFPSTNGKTAAGKASRKSSKAENTTGYMGAMHLPAAEERVASQQPGSRSVQDNLGQSSDQRLVIQKPNERTMPPLSASSQGGPSGSSSSIPQAAPRESAPAQPVFTEQRATQGATYHSASSSGQTSNSARPAAKNPRSASKYSGQVQLTQSEENVDSTDVDPAAGMRISSQPMDPVAARAQAQFAEQTDSQLTQGSAGAIHGIPNAQAQAKPASTSFPAAPRSSTYGQYSAAQYTPSAQEATSGAYSAPKAQAEQTQAAPPVTPAKKKKQAKKTAAAAAHPRVPTLAAAPAAPLEQQAQPTTAQETELPSAPAPGASNSGLSDDELQQRNLPPLRGSWTRVQREPRAVSPRDEAEMQLRGIESGYSGWLGGSGLLNYRSGDLGYNHLSALEAPFEVSLPLGYAGRFTIIAKPVFLDSGQADGTAVTTVQQQTTAGTKTGPIPTPIGTLTATDTTIPAQQNAAGLGGEMQLAFHQFAIAGGYTPSGFLVATITGRMQWKPGDGPFTFNLSRDSVKDTQLSYAGLRDPSGNTLDTLGQIWGGVVADQGTVQYAHGDQQSGFYFGGGGQYLSGYQVQVNNRIEGSGGAYWRILASPENGTLSVGANFFGMHYAHNENAFTHGMGGYFSPQAYFLANAPFTWNGHYGTAWHYNIMGSLGVQAFQENLTPLWPLAVDKALETAMGNAALPAKTSVGPNYDLRGQTAYQIGPHWFVGGFLTANTARNYSTATVGFSIRYLFRSQPSTAAGPTGLFPSDGIRPYSVP